MATADSIDLLPEFLATLAAGPAPLQTTQRLAEVALAAAVSAQSPGTVERLLARDAAGALSPELATLVTSDPAGIADVLERDFGLPAHQQRSDVLAYLSNLKQEI